MLRINTFFVALLFLLGTGSGHGQPVAEVCQYGGQEYEDIRRLISLSNGEFLAVGTLGSDTSNTTNIYVLKLDEDLQCIWGKSYGGTGIDRGYGVVEDAAGNYLVAGYTQSAEGGYDAVVYKIDQNGLVIWRNVYGGDNWDFGYTILEHPVGGFVLVGSTFSHSNGEGDGYVVHIDEDGELLNEWWFGGEGFDEFIKADVSTNGLFFILTGTSMDAETQTESCYVVLMDLNGNLVADENIAIDNHPTRGVRCVPISDGYLLGVNFQVSDSWTNYEIRRLDSSFNLLWSQRGDYNMLTDVISVSDGYVMLGQSAAFGAGGLGAMIEKRNQNGDYINAPTFGGAADEFAYALHQDELGRVYILGSSNSYTSNNFNLDVYLVRLPDAQIVPDYILELYESSCFEVSISASQEVLDSSVPFVISNRVLKNHKEEAFKAYIYDVQGRLVFQYEGIEVDLSALASGLYILTTNGGGFSARYKFVLE